MVERLTALPVEPTRAIAPSYDLVSWSRLGSSYEPEDLDDLLAARDLYEDGSGIRPMADLRLHLAEMDDLATVGRAPATGSRPTSCSATRCSTSSTPTDPSRRAR